MYSTTLGNTWRSKTGANINHQERQVNLSNVNVFDTIRTTLSNIILVNSVKIKWTSPPGTSYFVEQTVEVFHFFSSNPNKCVRAANNKIINSTKQNDQLFIRKLETNVLSLETFSEEQLFVKTENYSSKKKETLTATASRAWLKITIQCSNRRQNSKDRTIRWRNLSRNRGKLYKEKRSIEKPLAL